MTSRARLLGLLTLLVMAAFALRMINLERQPLHFDEAINVVFGSRAPWEVLTISQETFDNNPPAHRLALNAWMRFGGPTPFSIRYFSVLWGVLMIPLTWRTLRALRLRREVSITAALLVALSAYAVDYSQEAKGYAMGAALAALSWWMWVTLTNPRTSQRGLRWVIYIASTALSIGTHYYTVFLLPMQWVWWFGSQLTPRQVGDTSIKALFAAKHFWGKVAGRLAAQVAACVPLLIWVALMFQTLQVSSVRASSYREPVSAFALLYRILTEFSITRYADELTSALTAAVLALAALIGAVVLWRRGGDECTHAFWFGVSILVPIAAAMALQQRVTFFFPRFFMYLLPNLCVLIAACIWQPVGARMARALRWMPAAIALVVSAAGNGILQSAPLDTNTEYQGLVSQIRPHLRQGDVFLAHYIWLEGFFKSYAPQESAQLSWLIDEYDDQAVEPELLQVAARQTRMWFLMYKHDPDATDIAALQWLRRNTAYVRRFLYNEVNAQLFDGRAPANYGISSSVIVSDVARLDYAELSTNVYAGDSVPVQLTWNALRAWDEHASIFVHLIGPDGALVAQADGDAVNGFAPNFTWLPGQPVVDRLAIMIPLGLAPGQYELRVGMYLTDGGARLPVGNTDHARIGIIQVLP